ncbi:hypothetical protein FQR65_LT02643 [Abscondita terminalis]|nr:hypothetical protein FQR65_LT02643 [Abscondita terminalis]
MYRFNKFAIIVIILYWNNGNANISNYKHPGLGIANSIPNHSKLNTLISTVSLTQSGYIQFLRYIVDVPVITEFTFCLWIKSKNLTYAHPLLSYSEHEKTRYIRSWISPQGKEINLAVLENQVFTIATNFQEKRWYHICQSWDSSKGFWAFYLNGNLVLSNHDNKLKGLKIPEGGDLVVGQEYTDFDKGLDDGIDGDIYGFNLILSSTRSSRNKNVFLPYGIQNRAYDIDHSNNKPIPINTYDNSINNYEEIPTVLSYFIGANRAPRNMLDDGKNLLYNFFQIFDSPEIIRIKTVHDYSSNNEQLRTNGLRNGMMLSELAVKRIGGNGIVSDLDGINQKPLGLQLVELSYNCALRKGSPIEHKKVLVSWTRTPVRVFGGAILKNVRPFCFKQNAG